MKNKFRFKRSCAINGNIMHANSEYTIIDDVIHDGCLAVCNVAFALENKLGEIVQRVF